MFGPGSLGAGAEEITLRLLYQLIVILVATRIVTRLVRRLHRPRSGRADLPDGSVGVCMNTRGLMELIVLNVGKDLGIRWLMQGQARPATPGLS